MNHFRFVNWSKDNSSKNLLVKRPNSRNDYVRYVFNIPILSTAMSSMPKGQCEAPTRAMLSVHHDQFNELIFDQLDF